MTAKSEGKPSFPEAVENGFEIKEPMACLWQGVGLGCRASMTVQSEGKPSLPKEQSRAKVSHRFQKNRAKAST